MRSRADLRLQLIQIQDEAPVLPADDLQVDQVDQIKLQVGSGWDDLNFFSKREFLNFCGSVESRDWDLTSFSNLSWKQDLVCFRNRKWNVSKQFYSTAKMQLFPADVVVKAKLERFLRKKMRPLTNARRNQFSFSILFFYFFKVRQKKQNFRSGFKKAAMMKPSYCTYVGITRAKTNHFGLGPLTKSYWY